MELRHDVPLRHFEFWSGAVSRANMLTLHELDRIELAFEELYPDGMTDTDVNDIFWFEEDFIAQCLGYRNWEALEEDEEE